MAGYSAFGPAVSDGIPIRAGQKLQLRVSHQDGGSRTLDMVRFGVHQLEPDGAGVLAPGGEPGGSWEPAEVLHIWAARPSLLRKFSASGATVWTYEPSDPGTVGDGRIALMADGQAFHAGVKRLSRVDAAGNPVWVVDYDQVFALVTDPAGSWLLGHGRINVADGTQGMFRVDPSDGTVLWHVDENAILAAAADRDGNLYSALDGGTIQKRDLDGNLLWTFTPPVEFGSSRSVAHLPNDGSVHAAYDYGGEHRVVKVAASGDGTLWVSEPLGQSANDRGRVAVDQFGNTFVGHALNPRLTMLDGGGDVVWQGNMAGTNLRTESVAVDPEGNLFVATGSTASDGRRVRRFERDDPNFPTLVWAADLGGTPNAVVAAPGIYDTT